MRILYIDIDTLRPDHLGCYGYNRNTSPNIDLVAKEGVQFNNYFASDAPCLPSRAACFTGQPGIRTGIVGHGGTAADMRLAGGPRTFQDRLNSESMAGFLRKQNLYTALISPFAERHSAWWFYSGFNEMHNTGKGGNERADEITPVVMDWLNKKGKDKDWFLHVNYWDPHTIYKSPEEFGNPFENEPMAAWLTPEVFAKHREHVGPHSAREVSMWNDKEFKQYPRHKGELKTWEDAKSHMDNYDCGIAYMDGHLGKIFEKLKADGIYDDTAIIISSDHGENQGELGLYAEHGTADVITHRIPMIIKWPNGKKDHAEDGLLYNYDLLPTLASLLGSEPAKSWDGKSYAESITKGEKVGRPYLVVGQCAHVVQRGVRFDKWHYMRTYHDGFHLFPKEMLFNIEADPHEQNDLAEKHPEICKEAAWNLLEWHDEMMMKGSEKFDNDPLWTVIKEGGPLHARGMLKQYCDRLDKTERGWAIEELKKRHPREFK